jgi:hypothetical protein
VPNPALLLGEVAGVTALLALPAAGGALFARRRGVRSLPLICVAGLAVPCVIGYAGVGLYLISPAVGRVSVAVLYGTAVLAAVYLGVKADSDGRALLRWGFALLAATAAAALFALGLGFLRGDIVSGRAGILATAQVRYAGPLPNDAAFPYWFAQQLLARARPLPHYLTPYWQSSDRPPLQTGVYLLVRSVVPYSDPSAALYQVTGTVLQCLWVPAAWCVLGAARIGCRGIACGILAIAATGFVLMNSFFVWPKLFPAAFLLLLAAVLLADDWAMLRGSRAAGALCGVAAALALLGHEASALVLVPMLVLVLVVPRYRPAWRSVGAAATATVLLVAPWVLYQQIYDPPGDNLTKLQLAGQSQAARNPHQSLFSAIFRSYGHLSAAQVAHSKWSNLATPFGHGPLMSRYLAQLTENLFAGSGAAVLRRGDAVAGLRSLSFVYLLPAVGLLVLGVIAIPVLCWRRRARGPDIRLAGRAAVLLVLSVVFWAVVLFGPGATTNQQGSFALPLLLLVVGVIGLWRLAPAAAAGITAVHVAATIVVYAVLVPSYGEAPQLSRPASPAMIVLAGIGLTALLALCLWGPDPVAGDATPRRE